MIRKNYSIQYPVKNEIVRAQKLHSHRRRRRQTFCATKLVSKMLKVFENGLKKWCTIYSKRNLKFWGRSRESNSGPLSLTKFCWKSFKSCIRSAWKVLEASTVNCNLSKKKIIFEVQGKRLYLKQAGSIDRIQRTKYIENRMTEKMIIGPKMHETKTEKKLIVLFWTHFSSFINLF